MELSIHRLRHEDVEAVSRIEEASFSMPWSPQAFTALVDAPGALYLTAAVGEQTVGCCGLTQVLDEGAIDNVVVDAAYRGRGIAGRMLAELLRQGRAQGIMEFTLEVRVSNRSAVRVYEKLGFEAVGIRPGFYEKPREDALIMWLYRQGAPG